MGRIAAFPFVLGLVFLSCLALIPLGCPIDSSTPTEPIKSMSGIWSVTVYNDGPTAYVIQAQIIDKRGRLCVITKEEYDLSLLYHGQVFSDGHFAFISDDFTASDAIGHVLKRTVQGQLDSTWESFTGVCDLYSDGAQIDSFPLTASKE